MDFKGEILYTSKNLNQKKLIEYDDSYDNIIYKYKNKYYECIEKELFNNESKILIKVFNDITIYYSKIIDLQKEISRLKQNRLTNI